MSRMLFRPVFNGSASVPVGPLMSVSRIFDQMFEEAHAEPTASLLPLDITEDEHNLIIRASLPGYSHEQVRAEIKEGVLTIAAERPTTESADGERWHRRERRQNSVRRQVALPFVIQEDQVQATLINGELTLQLPKVPKPAPTRISIGTGPAAQPPASQQKIVSQQKTGEKGQGSPEHTISGDNGYCSGGCNC